MQSFLFLKNYGGVLQIGSAVSFSGKSIEKIGILKKEDERDVTYENTNDSGTIASACAP